MNYLLCRSVLCQFALILSLPLSLSLSVLFILLAKHIFEFFGTHQNRKLEGRGRFVRIAPGSFGPGYAEWLSGRQDQKWVVQVTYDMARHRMTWFCFQLVFVPCYLVGLWWINYINYICLIHRIAQKFSLQSYSERIQERYIADRAGPMSAGLLDWTETVRWWMRGECDVWFHSSSMHLQIHNCIHAWKLYSQCAVSVEPCMAGALHWGISRSSSPPHPQRLWSWLESSLLQVWKHVGNRWTKLQQ